MKGIIVGGLLFVALALLSVVFLIPGAFGLVHGLFESSDLGTIAGIIVAIIVAGLCFQVAALASIFVGAFVND